MRPLSPPAAPPRPRLQLPTLLVILTTASFVCALTAALSGLPWFSSTAAASPGTFLLTTSTSLSCTDLNLTWRMRSATLPSWSIDASVPVTSPWTTVSIPLPSDAMTTLTTLVGPQVLEYMVALADYAFAVRVVCIAAGGAMFASASSYALLAGARCTPLSTSIVKRVTMLARGTSVTGGVLLLAALAVFLLGLTLSSQNMTTVIDGVEYALLPSDLSCMQGGMFIAIAGAACGALAACASACCMGEQEAMHGRLEHAAGPVQQGGEEEENLNTPLLPPSLSIQSALVQQPMRAFPPMAAAAAVPMFCTSCGNLRAPQARYCAYCGVQVWSDSAAVAVGYTPPSATGGSVQQA